MAPAPMAAPPAATATNAPSRDTVRNRKSLNIAISDFQGKDISQAQAELITEQVRNEMITRGYVRVMERTMMDQILKEQGFQQSGSCDNNDCQVKVGQLLGVDRMIVGSIGRVGSIHMINAKMVSVQTGEVLLSKTLTCECRIEDVLQKTAPQLAREMEEGVRKEFAGALHVESNPPGAKVVLSGKVVGTTPFQDDLVEPGSYKLALILDDWNRVEQPVEIDPHKTRNLNISLERSREWLDAQRLKEENDKRAALEHEKEAQRQAEASRKQRRLMWQIGLSALSALSAGGGYYFQTRVDFDQSKADAAYNQYKSLGQGQQDLMDAQKSTVQSWQDRRKSDASLRNVGYGLALAALSSISFTFLF